MSDKLTPRQQQYQDTKAAEAEKDRAYSDALAESIRQFEKEYGVSQVVTDAEKTVTKIEGEVLSDLMLREVQSWDDDPEFQEILNNRRAKTEQTIMERIAADGKANPPTIEEARQSLTLKLWVNMVGRCTDTSNLHYRHWGAQGVRVHESWVKSFDTFVADVGLCPSPLYELKRTNIAANPHYEPGNVAWVERTVQRRADGKQPGGRPKRGQQVLIEYDGKMVTMPELSQLTGIKLSTIRARHAAGKPLQQILSPVRANATGESWSTPIKDKDGAPVIVTLKEMCEAKKLPYATVKARLKRGIPLGMAFYPRKPKMTAEERRAKQRAQYQAKKAKAAKAKGE